jgi:maleylpyruvate isomerase
MSSPGEPVTVPARNYDTVVAWLEAGEEQFARALAGADGDLARPSRLPGWSRAHVAAHIARNADGFCNLLTWARTGVETPMYPDAATRNIEIEAGAQVPAALLVVDVHDAAARLARAVGELPVQRRGYVVRNVRGAEFPASDIAWMRSRELWIHAVDLDTGARFDDAPVAAAVAMADEVADGLGANPACPSFVMRASDADYERALGAGTPDGEVTGPAAELLGWLSGRLPGDGLAVSGTRPSLPAWL